MSGEVTRAGSWDIQRHLDHLDHLAALGYVNTQGELDVLRQQILDARTLHVLDEVLAGFPAVPPPPQPLQTRDWGRPRNFGAACSGIGAAGLLLAVLPATALSHHGDTTANVLSALFITIGVLIAVASVIICISAAVAWDGNSPNEKRRRMRDYR